jgi:hypothetical protein
VKEGENRLGVTPDLPNHPHVPPHSVHQDLPNHPHVPPHSVHQDLPNHPHVHNPPDKPLDVHNPSDEPHNNHPDLPNKQQINLNQSLYNHII